ncbi:GTP cyclohydrolase II [Candidatus Daviesbacteria bacterium]|nr:GTP cyclohydrolase II [Candidatus Daviesbacteria bacterium]
MNTLKRFSSATLPTTYGVFKIIIYRSPEDGLEHTVLIKGQNLTGPVLVRIHSQCLTGESFSSHRCDCQDQLIKSLTKISKTKVGVLIYLSQEGRGIGLGNKIKAYALQEKGLDTVEANEQLGFAADSRSYKVAAQILKDLKIKQINLLTNNPDKTNQLKNFGIKVNRVIPLEITSNPINISYLKTKKNKMGHKLKLV